jgi:hypothetical protein
MEDTRRALALRWLVSLLFAPVVLLYNIFFVHKFLAKYEQTLSQRWRQQEGTSSFAQGLFLICLSLS